VIGSILYVLFGKNEKYVPTIEAVNLDLPDLGFKEVKIAFPSKPYDLFITNSLPWQVENGFFLFTSEAVGPNNNDNKNQSKKDTNILSFMQTVPGANMTCKSLEVKFEKQSHTFLP